MNEQLWGMVEELREAGALIRDEEAEEVSEFCYRKMEIAKIEDQVSYLPLLFADEIRNYLYRKSVNATSILRMIREEGVA